MALITYFIASVVILRILRFSKQKLAPTAGAKSSFCCAPSLSMTLEHQSHSYKQCGQGFVSCKQRTVNQLETLESEGKINVDNIEAVNLNGAMTAKLSITIDDEVACNEVEAFAKKAIKANSELHSAFITCRGEKGKRLLRGKH